MKLLSIHQPNFLPWIGYFFKIYCSHTFVFHDRILTGLGKKYTRRTAVLKPDNTSGWITIGVSRHKEDTWLQDVKISDPQWKSDTCNKLKNYYRKAPFFSEIFPSLEGAVRALESNRLVEVNIALIRHLTDLMGLECQFVRASQMQADNPDKRDYILDLIQELKFTCYLSGTGATQFQNPAQYEEKGIQLVVQDMFHFLDNHPYPQTNSKAPFVNGLSILDPLFFIGIAGTKDLFAHYAGELALLEQLIP